MAEARRALQFILDMHEPYPAFVLDRMWRIVLWNRTQGFLLQELHGPGGSPADLNALDMVLAPGPTRESFLNWEEVARAVLRRLRRQVARSVSLKYVPDIFFIADDSFDEAGRIDALLRRADVARDLEQGPDDEDGGHGR